LHALGISSITRSMKQMSVQIAANTVAVANNTEAVKNMPNAVTTAIFSTAGTSSENFQRAHLLLAKAREQAKIEKANMTKEQRKVLAEETRQKRALAAAEKATAAAAEALAAQQTAAAVEAGDAGEIAPIAAGKKKAAKPKAKADPKPKASAKPKAAGAVKPKRASRAAKKDDAWDDDVKPDPRQQTIAQTMAKLNGAEVDEVTLAAGSDLKAAEAESETNSPSLGAADVAAAC
jgi:hypothetical protein